MRPSTASRAILAVCAGLLTAVGCGSEDARRTNAVATEPAPASSTGAPEPQCARSSDCETGGLCTAQYDPVNAGPELTQCGSQCIARDALGLWCLDSAGCCEGLRCSSVDGLCIAQQGASSSSGTSSSGTSSSGTSSSGASSSSSATSR